MPPVDTDRDLTAGLESPVRAIPTDTGAEPESGVALCLSGGGYRAMLFHLGVIWRLREAGWLERLDRVSSVSGGSITAAVLALAPADDFEGAVVGRLRGARAPDARLDLGPRGGAAAGLDLGEARRRLPRASSSATRCSATCRAGPTS